MSRNERIVQLLYVACILILVVIVIIERKDNNDVKQIEVVKVVTATYAPMVRVSPQAIIPIEEMNTPETLAMRKPPVPTDTPVPTNTPVPTGTPVPTDTPVPTETPDDKIQKLEQTYRIATVAPIATTTNKTDKIQVQAFAPMSTNEMWQTTKTMLIDLGLWYPIQSFWSILLVIIFVFIIFKRLQS